MGMTLDEYLAEIDGWKQPVSDKMLASSATARKEQDSAARAWLEAKLGRSLATVPWPLHPEIQHVECTSSAEN